VPLDVRVAMCAAHASTTMAAATQTTDGEESMSAKTTASTRREHPLSTYERYLNTEQLFALQKPPEEQIHAEELTFQVVHQTIELWWKVTIQQFGAARDALSAGQVEAASWALRRAVAAQRVVGEAVRQLEFVAPRDFLSFRGALGNGSGADSPGFKAILRTAPPLWQAFETALAREHVTLLDLYLHPREHFTLYQCAEALVDFDEQFHLFRARHLKLAERQLGMRAIGTGGTPMPALERTLRDLLFPPLWAVRDELLAAMQPHADSSATSGH
jgi:tryptophan 2,3-dioxygenase